MSAPSWLLAEADDQLALFDADTDTEVTYRDLCAQVASRADAVGNCAGAVVLLGISNTIESVVDYLGYTEAGATVLLADPTSSVEVVDGWVVAYQPEVVRGFGHFDERAGAHDGTPRAEAVLLPTSGSTGSPKFVRLSTTSLAANARQIVEALGIGPADRGLAHLPLFYSYGLSVLNSHLAAGAAVVLTSTSAIRPEFWDAIERGGVTSLPGVPYSYELFRRMGLRDRDLPRLTDLTQAGGRLAPDRILEYHEMMAARGGRMWVMYGQTEASARISVLPAGELPDRGGSVGRALPHSRVWVDSPDATGLGELMVEGPQVMLGYASGRDDLDGPDQCGGVLSTGDVGRVDADGWISVTGRLKRMAKVFGSRVNLDDVERQLTGFGSLAAVDDGDRVAVFIEATEIPPDMARRMERHLRFPPRAIKVHQIDALPTTSAGKINYQELRAACP